MTNEQLSEYETFLSPSTSIAVCITTKDRYEVFKESYSKWKEFSPGIDIFVVDDGSVMPVPEATRRNEKPLGIAAAKNMCFELAEQYEHIFLSDDDFYPIAHNWWEPYINSGEPHCMFIFRDFPKGPKLHDTIKLYEDDKIIAYSHPRGCLLYYHRSCLELVGGMDTAYGRWGYDHVNLSDRIYKNGLTRFRYMDVPGSDKLFYSGDEHRTVKSTVWGRERDIQIQRNKRIYEANVNSTAFIPYKEGQKKSVHFPHSFPRDEVLTCYFTGVPDPQGREWKPNAQELNPLINSLVANNVDGYHCFHDVFVDGDWLDLNDEYYTRKEATINPYWQRWVTYREYLITHRHYLGFVWCVDATDVEMLRDPFPHMERGKLYVGDEPGNIGGNLWLTRHHKHPQLQYFFRNNRSPILNAGLVGGDVETMIEFTGHMIDIYQRCEHDHQIKGWPNSGMTDMGALNYVVYTYFKGRFSHGVHVNTLFKGYEADNGISKWRHK